MKKYVLLFSVFLLCVFSCNNDDVVNPDLLGKWRLVAQLVDPGDGSGTFQPINSDMELEFLADGVLKVSNGDLCALTIPSEGNSTENYDVDENEINVSCENPVTINYEIKEGSLFLYFLCIEGCAQQYRKLF
ncbi:lipocalin family protein [Aquimarina sp. 2201CG14-23]|uniref:lipocalin family protein n=1 Tax=Aquimarina mycalae TaxID=3040073 RepID=UPI002477CED5|nr:lipocalin family protein [Aquimarina sp. 2201CG14-23]MDH7445637.1 lipocalin family protein [Aquimarina sp. 2201CG14-23]